MEVITPPPSRFEEMTLVDAHFWQKGPMTEKAQQYERDGERKQQSKNHWVRIAEIMVQRPTK